MALPISAGEIFDVAKFAFDLWQSCKAAKGEFEQIGQEVLFMRTTIEMVHIDCEDPQSIINLVDNKEKTVRKQLRVLIGNCQRALKAVEQLLKRYERMSVLERMKWAFSGHAEVSSLESNLSSFATQLDSYVQKLEVKGQGLINKNVGLVNKDVKAVIGRLGRLEDLIEKYNGDEKAAVKEILQERQGCSASQSHRMKSETVMMDYAKEVSKPKEEKQRPKTPDPPRGRPKDQGSTLDIPKPEKRTVSADTSSTVGAKKLSPHTKKPNFTLECWLIQRRSAHALFVTFELSEKESQSRGQWKLRQMATQFNSSREHDKLDAKHDLVQWVMKDRKKKEENPRFTWYPYAAKIEQKDEVLLGMGVEEQAMVIIKRQLTPEAQKIADDKAAAKAKETEKKAKAKKDAAKKKAAEAALKKEKSMQAARIKELEELNRLLKMQKLEKDTAQSANEAENVDIPGKDQKKEKTQPEHTKRKSKDAISDKDEKIKGHALDDPKKPKSGKSHSSERDAKGDGLKNNTNDEAAKSKAIKAGQSDKKSLPKAKKTDSTQNEVEDVAVSKSKKTEKTKAVESDKKPLQKMKKTDSTQDEADDTATSKSKRTEKTADIQSLLNENAKLKAALKAAGFQESLEEEPGTAHTGSPKPKDSKERHEKTDQPKVKKQDFNLDK